MIRRRAPGVVPVIIGLFIASALIRLAAVGETGIATARAQAAEHIATEADIPAACPAPPEELVRALTEREARLQRREAQFEDRLRALGTAEAEITARIAELEAAEARLAATVAISDSAAERDLAALTAVYENMRAEEAAALFTAMSPDFAAGFLGRMRPDAAAAILAGLEPERAYAVSVILAGRNALAPRE